MNATPPCTMKEFLQPDFQVQEVGVGVGPTLRVRASEVRVNTAMGTHLNYEIHNSGPIRLLDQQGEASMVISQKLISGVLHYTIFTPSMEGWYSYIMRGPLHPYTHSGRSIRAKVISGVVGEIGNFRRSRKTGLAFNCRHREHMWGNPCRGDSLLQNR